MLILYVVLVPVIPCTDFPRVSFLILFFRVTECASSYFIVSMLSSVPIFQKLYPCSEYSNFQMCHSVSITVRRNITGHIFHSLRVCIICMFHRNFFKSSLPSSCEVRFRLYCSVYTYCVQWFLVQHSQSSKTQTTRKKEAM